MKKRQTNVLKTLPFLKWICYYISKESEYMFGHNRSEDKGDFYLSDMKEE